ncbi:hypothetical protein MMC18_005601 [Xylographa bjoerkii]|nr:hypothetical protein [Xylographa bjoerkii]
MSNQKTKPIPDSKRKNLSACMRLKWVKGVYDNRPKRDHNKPSPLKGRKKGPSLLKGRKRPAASITKMKDTHKAMPQHLRKGMKWTEEQRTKRMATRSLTSNPRKSVPLFSETSAKISASHIGLRSSLKGVPKSAEHRAALSAGWARRKERLAREKMRVAKEKTDAIEEKAEVAMEKT